MIITDLDDVVQEVEIVSSIKKYNCICSSIMDEKGLSTVQRANCFHLPTKFLALVAKKKIFQLRLKLKIIIV